MSVRLRFTDSSVEHIARHGVTWQEVEQALGGPYYRRKRGNRILPIARTMNRILTVVLEPSLAEPEDFEIVTARDATATEKRLFTKRAR